MGTPTRTRLLRIIQSHPSGVDIQHLAAALVDIVGMRNLRRNLTALEDSGLIDVLRCPRPGRGHRSIYRPAGGAQ